MPARLWSQIKHRFRDTLLGRPPLDGTRDPEERELRRRGETLLRGMLGRGAAFREGQWEAIASVVCRKERVLVVQRTGWGKSMVYFLATRLMRERGAGPTLLISPLLSLMRNQIVAAEKIGVRALTINSDNRNEWEAVEAALARDECDVLLVSPERLAMRGFLARTLDQIGRRVGMLAVDEAHCISDWGHDFRPDYRRITAVLRRLPPGTPVLATTATANSRVISDVEEQLGPGLKLYRGSLARESLGLHVVGPLSPAARLAWLAEQVSQLPGSGIIYCPSVADCCRVSDWLLSRGIAAPPYYSALDVYRQDREALLLDNRVKALVATVALGMGFDKPDLGFVIHYGGPGSVVAYYQQVGRAGRALDDAAVILLHGDGDDDIHQYFIDSAFPTIEDVQSVLAVLETGLTGAQLLGRINISPTRLEKILKRLELDGAIEWQRGRYHRIQRDWTPDAERERRVTDLRRHELARMRAYTDHLGCRMVFLTAELDDPDARRCGRCDRCAGARFSAAVPDTLLSEALTFLRTDERVIEPRLQWPEGIGRRESEPIPHPNEPGRALCLYGDEGWGGAIRSGKFRERRFGDPLVEACVEMIQQRWRPTPAPEWVTAIPSHRRPDLVPEFAARVARRLGLPFHAVLAQVSATSEQKEMKNSILQVRNVLHAFKVAADCPSGPVLLIDDIVDSRWTLTITGHLIRAAGGGPVHPMALAEAATRAGLQ